MDEETPAQDRLLISLSEEDAKALERDLTWPEEREAWDRLNAATKLYELAYGLN